MSYGMLMPFVAPTSFMQSTSMRLEVDIVAHKWKDIRRKHSPEVEAEIQRKVKALVDSVTLNQVREARNLTQANLANILGVNQGSVSKMEKRTDMYVSTLRSFIQAMGGQLQIKAVFPEGEVEIDQFESVANASSDSEDGAAA
ncbi:MAG TPA: XRE family transcriptional regulator [Terracidiphilus sp.]|nr:XRE family transcriptional regulator [Terracidiphilus sp.]